MAGLVLNGLTAVLYPLPEWDIFAVFVLLAASLLLVLRMLLKYLAPELWTPGFVLPVGAHYLDALTTFLVLGGGGKESMFVASMFIGWLGRAGIFVLKTLVVVPAVLYVFLYVGKGERRYLLAVITLLGAVAALRNLAVLLF